MFCPVAPCLKQMCCSLGLFIQHPVQICPPSTNTTDEPLVHDDPKCFLFSEHPQKVLAWTVGIAAQVHTAQDYEIILQKNHRSSNYSFVMTTASI